MIRSFRETEEGRFYLKYAVKKAPAYVYAYCLGEDSDMEKLLLRKGKLRRQGDSYQVFSQEAVNGQGQLAVRGDYIKVDMVEGELFPYPNRQDFFLKNHQQIQDNLYRQRIHSVPIWQADDPVCQEIEYLLRQGILVINQESAKHYFGAYIWNTYLSASRDATVVFYEITEDSRGEISGIDFNFVAKEEFQRMYRIEN